MSAILQNNECLVDPLVSLASAFDAANAELVMLDKIITILTSTKDNNRISSNLHLSYSSMSALPCYSNCSVIATKAPKGTLLDVPPNPDSGSGYQLYVKSSLGNVDVFLVTMSSGSVIDSSIEHEGDHAEYAGRLILWYK
ncbi:hypothetical protein TL16_g09262 [Triparma laevis f. inornata]|uniref:E2F transcription factor CC-MB domain-containing protein n=1 Tax=Triparma laevis f. inornata TaxID=1714386 RepID=A0A9W7B239_9STRA|nr:hypothetical protein TL16_g09262 [Triparma laevis f. inornata]